MAAPMKTAMPPEVQIGSAYTLQIAALDATTGNAVAGVNISNMMIEVEYLGNSLVDDLAYGPFMLVPGPSA